ncbi:class I SAM-dependent methyltransferase [Croceicoccus mobilis]|uniref:SAM-dependent methyltransferase n=1 Tax=Croceicoccus mobilis TaxID=1703339 RepID=A0A916YZI3_9SPHN|nr:class I SAM-dependent methyltransferase [Croceicoccus mobilis]GGD68727.1 SAM-dependent methyltransferase [Croceicoccus mobilis]
MADIEDIAEFNRQGWNAKAEGGDRWSIPVNAETIAAARRGEWEVVLTPSRPVPREWFGDIAGKDLLGLASGGGQQCPIFAAAGANVTSFDASDGQLARDTEVATREGLTIRTVRGLMHDLSVFADDSFDIIFHPCSNCFAPEILPVWRECARVLRPGGVLLSGFTNPLRYLFDEASVEAGQPLARHKIPYSDFDLPEEERNAILAEDPVVVFAHTLQDQIGGQLAAGFMLTDMFEDDFEERDAIGQLIDCYIATRAELRPR